ncbi:uncharacterized protein LOC129589661 [Paramacrobiotus metropolitanus]|uniref:uncharacterized protein LOC129589661 n=1 Tax=Paramacrobiotus metropolitanus TaxID=2943436 RepID=UPI002445D3A9|nr:uncharacterized protein LOC129589661 [Paramacrobiotus metropolitanus]
MILTTAAFSLAFLTFTKALTNLTIVGPSSVKVCAGFPPGANPSGASISYYPQLTFNVTNAPSGVPLIWDLPSNASPVAGEGAPSGTAVNANKGINSPAVLSGNEASVFISNMNSLAGGNSTSRVGIYGAGNNGDLPCPTKVNKVSVIPPETLEEIAARCCASRCHLAQLHPLTAPDTKTSRSVMRTATPAPLFKTHASYAETKDCLKL